NPEQRVFFPPLFQVAYHVMSTLPASETVAAIFIESPADEIISDLRTVQEMTNLPQTPIEARPVGNPAPQGPGNASSEFEIDTQAATGIAGEFKKLILYVDLTNAGGAGLPVAGINQWVTDDEALVASLSLSECELQAEADGSRTAIEAAL